MRDKSAVLAPGETYYPRQAMRCRVLFCNVSSDLCPRIFGCRNVDGNEFYHTPSMPQPDLFGDRVLSHKISSYTVHKGSPGLSGAQDSKDETPMPSAGQFIDHSASYNWRR